MLTCAAVGHRGCVAIDEYEKGLESSRPEQNQMAEEWSTVDRDGPDDKRDAERWRLFRALWMAGSVRCSPGGLGARMQVYEDPSKPDYRPFEASDPEECMDQVEMRLGGHDAKKT